jgi:hypothetical protein
VCTAAVVCVLGLLAEHAFAAWAGEPCTPVSHMLTAPNETTESPVNRPIAGVKASRLLIDSLLPPLRESCAYVVNAYQLEKAFPATLTRHLAVPRAAGVEFAQRMEKIHAQDHRQCSAGR